MAAVTEYLKLRAFVFSQIVISKWQSCHAAPHIMLARSINTDGAPLLQDWRCRHQVSPKANTYKPHSITPPPPKAIFIVITVRTSNLTWYQSFPQGYIKERWITVKQAQCDQVLLTPWSRILEKPTGFQLVNKFPTFDGTRRFITSFTSACHLSLSWATLIQSIPHTLLPEDPS